MTITQAILKVNRLGLRHRKVSHPKIAQCPRCFVLWLLVVVPRIVRGSRRAE